MSAGVRHGSGATGNHSDPRGPPRRGRRTPSPTRRSFKPGGPVTATEWDDVVQSLQSQIYKMNQTLNGHAHAIGQLKSEMESGTIPTIVQRIQSIETSVDARVAAIDTRFVDGGNRVDQRINGLGERLDVLRNEIRVFAAGPERPQVAQAPAPPPGMATENYNVSTPIVRPGNPGANELGQNGGVQSQRVAPATGPGPQQCDFGVPSPITSYNMSTGNVAGVDGGNGNGKGGGHVGVNGGFRHPPNVQFGASGVDNGGGQWASQHHRQYQQAYSHIQAPM